MSVVAVIKWTIDYKITSKIFVREPVAACLPLLPLIFPAWWVVINSATLANVLTLFRQVRLLV